MELIREIRNIDSDTIVINVPKEFRKKRVEILVLPLELTIVSPENSEIDDPNTSGLCGLWQEERTSDEIINDIYSHRTGYGNRKVTL